MVWPDNADGDVFRRMSADGLDFEQRHRIDFEVEFEHWPPAEEFVTALGRNYPDLEHYPPEGESLGYLHFVIDSKVTYELVMFVQQSVSDLAAPYGGTCETWGVLHD